MALTSAQLSLQLVAQLRALDPSISAEIGTPERKIIDTVAQALAEAQIDANLLSGATDITTKFGTDLDNYVGLFGFGRQTGSFATGFATFSRLTPSPTDIIVPQHIQVQGAATTPTGNLATSITVTFQTTVAVTLVAGQTSAIAPIQAVLPGLSGNLAAGAITQIANLGAPVLGITAVTNEVPTSNGSDQETDAELKIRFQNTVFRNVSGTFDQYMALAVSTLFSTKATVVGPISRYQEFVQVPAFDDAGNFNSVNTPAEDTGGTAGRWTTAASNNTYAKLIYTDAPYFVSDPATNTFYRQDSDFTFNAPPVLFGDVIREEAEGAPAPTPTQPNVTFVNVYQGADPLVIAPRHLDVALLEYSYLSSESRNDIARNITNCVDVYVNGGNPVTANTVLAPPTTATAFSTSSASPFYNQNFRRIGKPDTPPVATTHIFSGLFWEPVIDLPDEIVAGTNTYIKNIHYFPVEDKTLIGNTVRSRNGIEWDNTIKGATGSDNALNGGAGVSPWIPGQAYTTSTIVFYNGIFYHALSGVTSTTTPDIDSGHWGSIAVPYSGTVISAPGVTSIPIVGYVYDKNVVDLQTALEGSKQITTDVLAHRCTSRYFKLDVTVVYRPGRSPSVVNSQIQASVSGFFTNQYFGATIQLSDLLVLIRNTNGVQNVRWSNDETGSLLHRVTETDVDGNPRSPLIFHDSDFYLRDSELPALPTGQLLSDTLPGLIIRPRAQSNFSVL